MFAGLLFLFFLVIIYAARQSNKKDEQEEMKPSVIDARLRAPQLSAATDTTAGNLGISARSARKDWSQYDVPTVLRRRRAVTR